ncbi:MAG: hypothetical protein LBK60_07755 [Verrucomicrobiales bacterium]|jgi:ABC-type spermidine/putrescine transport system permease subunit II|nr:hypothetical protein [Verrucomicrobiales bacterium]
MQIIHFFSWLAGGTGDLAGGAWLARVQVMKMVALGVACAVTLALMVWRGQKLSRGWWVCVAMIPGVIGGWFPLRVMWQLAFSGFVDPYLIEDRIYAACAATSYGLIISGILLTITLLCVCVEKFSRR